MISVTMNSLGECLTAQKRFVEAEPLLTQSYNELKSKLGEQDRRVIEARQRLVNPTDQERGDRGDRRLLHSAVGDTGPGQAGGDLLGAGGDGAGDRVDRWDPRPAPARDPAEHLLLLARPQTTRPPGRRPGVQRFQSHTRLRGGAEPFVDRRAMEAEGRHDG